jgi:hypothetical protein
VGSHVLHEIFVLTTDGAHKGNWVKNSSRVYALACCGQLALLLCQGE